MKVQIIDTNSFQWLATTDI